MPQLRSGCRRCGPQSRAGGRSTWNLLAACLGAARRVQQLSQDRQLRVRPDDVVQDAEGAAADDHEATADRPVGVIGVEDRGAGVVQPRLPEQEALLAAWRVV